MTKTFSNLRIDFSLDVNLMPPAPGSTKVLLSITLPGFPGGEALAASFMRTEDQQLVSLDALVEEFILNADIEDRKIVAEHLEMQARRIRQSIRQGGGSMAKSKTKDNFTILYGLVYPNGEISKEEAMERITQALGETSVHAQWVEMFKSYYFGNKTMQQIGTENSITRERVRQVLDRTLCQIRNRPACKAKL